MAVDYTKLASLDALKQLAERIKTEFATAESVTALQTQVAGLAEAGGEKNVLTAVKVNGTALDIADKAVDIVIKVNGAAATADESTHGVDIKVPKALSDLTDDKQWQTAEQVTTAIQAAIAETGHAKFEVTETIPEPEAAEENVLYLYLNEGTGHYDIYCKVKKSGDALESEYEVVQIDDTSVDLKDYAKTADIESQYVKKDGEKQLSTEDYTTEDKTKLAGLQNYTHDTHDAHAEGLYKVTVDDKGHVTAATAVVQGDITALNIATTDKAEAGTKDGLMSKEDKTKLDGFTVAETADIEGMIKELWPDAEPSS